MQCVKTGFNIYIQSLNKSTRLDLFFDGMNLYTNYNELYDGKWDDIEITCDYIESFARPVDRNQRFQIINPIVDQSVVEYVDSSPYKSRLDILFVEKYKA